MTKKEETKDKLSLNDMENDNGNYERLSWVTNNHKQRKKKKTYTGVMQIGCEKKRNFLVLRRY